MRLKDFKKFKLPANSGIYFFKKGKEILYIGKATSLRTRVRSYFSKEIISTRGPMILDMVVQADNIKWQKTDSVLEALILEAELIKKHQPKYNIKEKDDKSFNYICITKDKWPKVLIIRGRNLKKEDYQVYYGPFPNGSILKEAMKIIRRIFPYIDEQSSKKNNKTFYKQLELIPATFEEYKNNIKNLKLFFAGKKRNVISNLNKEMSDYAKSREFEKASEVKKRIFAIKHINDVSLIKEESPQEYKNFYIPASFKIEAYDIAHMSGKNMVGVMTVIVNGQIAKNEYKKFIIRTQNKANDTGALEEILSRRLGHEEWGLPNLITVDGSTAQINMAKRVLSRFQFKIPVVGVVKDDKHKAKAIIGDPTIINKDKKSILLANSEAHRFAISFYRYKSRKNMVK